MSTIFISIQFSAGPIICIIKLYNIRITRIIQFCFVFCCIRCWFPVCISAQCSPQYSPIFLSCFIHPPDWFCHFRICSNCPKLCFITYQNVIFITNLFYPLTEIVSSFIIRWICICDILSCLLCTSVVCKKLRCFCCKRRSKHIIMCFAVSKIGTIFQCKNLSHSNFFSNIILTHYRFAV